MSKKRKCIIVDLDGTLCNSEHRLHYVKQNPPDWKNFLDGCVHDTLNREVFELCQMAYQSGMPIFFCSGRPEQYRAVTQEWFHEYGIPPYRSLMMRPQEDTKTPDHEIKKIMLDQIRAWGYDPIFAVDDRPTVIAMWRANGVPCFAMDDTNWRDQKEQ